MEEIMEIDEGQRNGVVIAAYNMMAIGKFLGNVNIVNFGNTNPKKLLWDLGKDLEDKCREIVKTMDDIESVYFEKRKAQKKNTTESAVVKEALASLMEANTALIAASKNYNDLVKAETHSKEDE